MLKNNKHILWSKRSTTIRREYISSILGETPDMNKELIEFYKQNGINSNVCVYCGEHASSLDHLFPLVIGKHFSGYTNDKENLVPSCQRCNSRKRNSQWDEWLSSDTEYTNKIRNEERIMIIKRFVDTNKSKEHVVDNETFMLLNKNCDEFEIIMKDCFDIMDSILNKHIEELRKYE